MSAGGNPILHLPLPKADKPIVDTDVVIKTPSLLSIDSQCVVLMQKVLCPQSL
jgi:hypothetical protein